VGFPGRLVVATFALSLAAGAVLPAQSGSSSAAASPAISRVFELQLNQEIEPVMAEYLVQGIDRANREGAALILITVDTPGGLDTSMREIIQHIIDSKTPVAVYVAPSGSRAASAGFFVLLSADIAAMAPGTHTGAASPIAAIGAFPVTLDDTMKSKILNDAVAYLRSFAAPRRRNVALAETAVTEAKAFTANEALDGQLCDLIAGSREELLGKLDGRVVTRFDGRTTSLALSDHEIVEVAMSPRQRFLARIVQPDMFFVLFLVGVLGLYAEFTHPGMIAPGVVGAIAMLLALFAMHLLPINLTGLLLIGLALALFVLEAKYTSHGVLGVGGVLAMLLGALMLVRSPLTGAGVSLGAALGATLPFGLITIVLMRLVLRSRAWQPQTGVEELLREVGEVTTPIDGGELVIKRGMVRVHGELWQATAGRAIRQGTQVRVLRVDGLTLQVEPLDVASRSSAPADSSADGR
jgi:membrane-bound serine protease (ClpP class)